MKDNVVIIGASITGFYAMNELVKRKFDGTITLIDQKEVYPYNTYPLSKEWMMDLEDMDPPLLKETEFYEKNKIDLRLDTKVRSVNWKDQIILTDRDEAIPYDHLVIATGSELRQVSLPGDDAEGIFYLREFKDARKIKEWARDIKRVAIIGAGFIGLELASTFTQVGKHVSVLVRSGRPLEKILGAEVSEYFTNMHESHGVEFLFDEDTEEFIQDENGHIRAIRTKSGKTINTDMVMVSVGVKPNLSFEIDSLETDRDLIIVNKYLETSLPNIYAGGDIVKWPYKDRMIHIEHWENAWTQGVAIAKNIMAAKSSEYDIDPYFWTDQYNETFEYVGNAKDWDRVLIRGSLDDGSFSVAYVDGSSIPLAILFANHAEEREEIEQLMKKEQPLDESRFTDPTIPIREI